MLEKIRPLALHVLVLIKKIFVFPKRILDKILFQLNILETYVRQDECHKYRDCVLLHKLMRSQPPASDRYIEYPWMIENIEMTSGRILDIGSTICDRLSASLPKTVEVHAINLNEKPIEGKEIKFKTGDIRKTDYPENYFDFITCISTLEHIGVSGRYGSDEDPDGDIRAMQEMRRILKQDGTLLITVPYGTRDVLPINKLYNKERIKKLFVGYEILEEEFRKFDPVWRVWLKVEEQEAGVTDMLRDRWYAIALIRAKKTAP